MSYTEHYKGKMTKLYKDMPLKDQLNAELKKWDIEMTYQIEYDEFGDNIEEIMEALGEEDSYFLYKDNLYLVGKNELNPYDDIMSAHKIDDDTIGFEVKYYNGGCGFEEALETALEGL